MNPKPAVATRIEVALIFESLAALAKLQGRTGMSQTDIVNRALQVYEFADEVLREGNELVVRTPDGRMQSVKISDVVR